MTSKDSPHIVNSNVKFSLVIGAALLAATALYLYFSPYHSCVRAMKISREERNISFDHIMPPKTNAEIKIFYARGVGNNN